MRHHDRRASPRGFTLLEVLLALALAVVILALVGLAVHVHLAVAAKSRDQVVEAQLARNLLQRIADDLRNAVPFQPPPSSSSSGGSGQSSASGGTASSSGTSATASTAPLSGGIYGTAQAIQIETARRPRAILASLQTASDPSQPARLSDLRVVSYSLGAPCTVDLSQNSPPAASGSGLYRHEQDRAMFFYGSQNGQADSGDPAKDLLAPEVIDFHIDYFGGTTGSTSTSGSGSTSSGSASTSNLATSGGTTNADSTANGTTSDDQWDSSQQSMLPAAVRISISLRHDAAKSLLGLLDNDKRPAVTYSLFVYLPNAAVDAVGQASQQAIQAPASSMFVSIMPQGGGGGFNGGGGGGGRFGGAPGRGFGENGGGQGGRGQGGRGRGGEAGNGGQRGGGEGGGEQGGNGGRGRGGRGRGGEGGGRQGEQGGRGGRGQGGRGGFGQGGQSSQGGG